MKIGWFLVLLGVMYAQNDVPYGNEDWRTFEKMCGQLVQTEQVTTKNGAHEEREKPLKKVALELYPRGTEEKCCESLALAARTLTGSDGSFDFRKITAGRYWVVARWNENIYQMPITFAPKPKTRTDCTTQGLSIGIDGEFKRWKKLVLD